MAEEGSSAKVSKPSGSSSGGSTGGIPKAVFVVSAVGMNGVQHGAPQAVPLPVG